MKSKSVRRKIFTGRQSAAGKRHGLDQGPRIRLASSWPNSATQLFRPFSSSDLILGAVGALQFDMIERRLQHEYRVAAVFEPAQVATAPANSLPGPDPRQPPAYASALAGGATPPHQYPGAP